MFNRPEAKNPLLNPTIPAPIPDLTNVSGVVDYWVQRLSTFEAPKASCKWRFFSGIAGISIMTLFSYFEVKLIMSLCDNPNKNNYTNALGCVDAIIIGGILTYYGINGRIDPAIVQELNREERDFAIQHARHLFGANIGVEAIDEFIEIKTLLDKFKEKQNELRNEAQLALPLSPRLRV